MYSTTDQSERRPLLDEAMNDEIPNPLGLVRQSTTHSSYDGTYDGTLCASQPGEPGRPLSTQSLFWSILWDSIPVILSYTLQNSVQTISILVAGRLGPDELSVAAIALMIAFVTGEYIGWCVALGGTTALDTLGSAAYTGGTPTDLSIHFQRCVIMLYLLFIPVGFLWAFMEPVLLALGQPANLSRDTQVFLRVLTLGAPGYIGFESLKKYLQCQGIMKASTTVLMVVSPINIVLNIWLIHYTSLGLLGSPVALSITYWLCFAILSIYTAASQKHKVNGAWGGFQVKAVLDIRSCYSFLKLAIPGIVMVGTEWTAFEIVALAAGRLGELPLAAQSIIMTTDQILNTIPFGIGVAASTRVGNRIGSRNASGAQRAAHVSAFLSVIVGALVMAMMMVFKDVYGYLFSDDVDVVKLVSLVMPLVASFQIADGLANSCGGVLRGQGKFILASADSVISTYQFIGKQHLGAAFNFVAYYVIALPLGITLAFHTKTHLGLQGLWIGQVLGLFIVGLGELFVVLRTDWVDEVRKGIERNEEDADRRVAHVFLH